RRSRLGTPGRAGQLHHRVCARRRGRQGRGRRAEGRIPERGADGIHRSALRRPGRHPLAGFAALRQTRRLVSAEGFRLGRAPVPGAGRRGAALCLPPWPAPRSDEPAASRSLRAGNGATRSGGRRRRLGRLSNPSPFSPPPLAGDGRVGADMATSTLLAELTARLSRAGFIAAEEEANELLARADGDGRLLDSLVARRLTGEPLAWVTGSTSFCGIEIRVDPGVYVPRWAGEPLRGRA